MGTMALMSTTRSAVETFRHSSLLQPQLVADFRNRPVLPARARIPKERASRSRRKNRQIPFLTPSICFPARQHPTIHITLPQQSQVPLRKGQQPDQMKMTTRRQIQTAMPRPRPLLHPHLPHLAPHRQSRRSPCPALIHYRRLFMRISIPSLHTRPHHLLLHPANHYSTPLNPQISTACGACNAL
jgi:hypothetical protein